MRINHNAAAVITANNLSNVNNGQAKVLQKMGSGQRINKASDDAAGLAISEKMRGEIAQLKQQKMNQQDLVAFTNAQDGVLSEASNTLVRMKQLVTQWGDSETSGDVMLDDTAIDNIRAELGSCFDFLQGLKDSKLNGKDLLSMNSFRQILSDSSELSNAQHVMEVDFNGLRLTPGSDSFILFGNGLSNTDQIDHFVDNLNRLRGAIGAKSNQAEAAVRNLSIQIENLQQSESNIRDADMAEESVEYQKNNILNTAATSMLTQANQQPQSVLSLLR